jgi:hypothetical protein
VPDITGRRYLEAEGRRSVIHVSRSNGHRSPIRALDHIAELA